MAFSQQTFLGATIKSMNCSASWGGGGSQTNLTLIEDPENGDRFNPPSVGAPVYCSIGNFRFAGLLQKAEETGSTDGYPTFSCTVVDPRSLLDNAQVCIGSYSGPTQGVANLYNVYGYWESTGFGNSGATEAGMPWLKVADALSVLTSSPFYYAYGGPLTYAGYSYALDLSSLPVPPSNYRISGGTFVNLLELIDMICEDGGCDYLVDLVGNIIKIRTISRRHQPTLNTIPKFLKQNKDIRLRGNYGNEMRNEVTSSFLIGGEQTSLFFTDAVTSFWGFDTRGVPILGNIGKVKVGDQSFPCDIMTLNGTAIRDITGSTRYPSNTIEMRHALGSQDLWMTYIKKNREGIAKRIGVESVFEAQNDNPKKKVDLLNDKDAVNIAKLSTAEQTVSNINRVYQFVLRHAEEYFGRQFFIRLPFVSRTQDPETNKVTTSYEISDSGFMNEGSSPLGLARIFEDIFRTNDGRFRSFVRFNNATAADLSTVSPQGSILQGPTLYVEANVHPVIMNAPQPGCVIQVSSPLFGKSLGMTGDGELLAETLGIAKDVLDNTQSREHIPLETTPDCYWPNAVAIPLKSNVLTYGPWYVSGAPGKVRVEHDSTLTPWSYGDFATMNAAGFAKVSNSFSNMLVTETGQVELAEIPRISLGGILYTGGPYCTNVDLRFDGGGYSTNYRFETYTPKFGVFSKGQVERMKRMGLAALETRRNITARARYQLAMQLQTNAGRAADKAFKNPSKILKRRSPHECMVSHTIKDGDAYRVTMQTASMEEAMSISKADSDEWATTSVMGLEGLFRPFTTETDGDGKLPGVGDTDFDGKVPDSKSLNPFGRKNGTDFLSWGAEYSSLNAFANEPDFEKTRAIGIRGPVIIAGVGYDFDCRPVPRESDSDTDFSEDAFTDASKAKVGPLDAMWDKQRGCWTYHTALCGKLKDEIVKSGESGEMVVETIDGPSWTQSFFNPYSSDLSGKDTFMTVEYFAHLNRFQVTSFDCTESGAE